MSKKKSVDAASLHPIVHTPGPWNLLCSEARGGPRCLVVCPKDNEIASINPFRESWNQDAELIAEAPEMFQVIQRLAEPGFMGEAELKMLIQECRRIVAKVV